MSSPKKEFTKEKTTLPDGRYLWYYNFETKDKPELKKPLKQTEEEEHV